VKPMKYFKECRAKECMEVCFYDGVHRMWMSSRVVSKPSHSKEAGEEVHTPDIYLLSWWWTSETNIGCWCVLWRARQFNVQRIASAQLQRERSADGHGFGTVGQEIDLSFVRYKHFVAAKDDLGLVGRYSV
jgi:hypothetical protein